MKQEELSLQDPFELSLSDHEQLLDENKRREDIEHMIIFYGGLLERIYNEN